ncbi:hypothetical protein AUR64_08160 [Haloprofundus marisrubri]|uniref:Uncharacterized protein n=1 Tax=Haloprofundus marisrubri TaxID=1514971 RepID=A0A0W1RBX8_9EURY|nr:hypothetical protein [Haloprofundus marisrubri]KTG10629.1 hypothetical protein AUR64_08160 [Haloprofundus marisrubri]
MNRPVWVALLCAVLIATSLAAPAADARPPPRELCGFCGENVESAAAEHGLDLTVERSTVTVHVHDNGSATWVVRNRIAEDAAATRLRTNDSLREAIVPGDPSERSSNIADSGTLVTRHTESEFAEESVAGTLRSGAFTEGYGYRNLAGLGADELTVVAPEGMRLGWTVSGSTVSEDRTRMTLTEFTDADEGDFVTFVPEDSTFGAVLSPIVVAEKLGPVAALNFGVFVGLPTALFATLVAGVAGAVSWLSTRTGRFEQVEGYVGTGLLAVGVLAVVFPLLSGSMLGIGGFDAPVFGIGVGLAAAGLALSATDARKHATFRTVLAGAVGVACLAAAAAIGGAALFGAFGVTTALLSSLPFVAPVFALLPAGYAVGRGERTLGVATATLAFALPVLSWSPLTAPMAGMALLAVFLAGIYAVAIAVLGAPLLLVGASLSGGQRSPATGR